MPERYVTPHRGHNEGPGRYDQSGDFYVVLHEDFRHNCVFISTVWDTVNEAKAAFLDRAVGPPEVQAACRSMIGLSPYEQPDDPVTVVKNADKGIFVHFPHMWDEERNERTCIVAVRNLGVNSFETTYLTSDRPQPAIVSGGTRNFCAFLFDYHGGSIDNAPHPKPEPTTLERAEEMVQVHEAAKLWLAQAKIHYNDDPGDGETHASLLEARHEAEQAEKKIPDILALLDQAASEPGSALDVSEQLVTFARKFANDEAGRAFVVRHANEEMAYWEAREQLEETAVAITADPAPSDAQRANVPAADSPGTPATGALLGIISDDEVPAGAPPSQVTREAMRSIAQTEPSSVRQNEPGIE